MSSVDFAQLSLFPATHEQKIESRKRTSVQWARGLSLEQYLQREAVLDEYEHARDEMITWVLAPRDDPRTLNFMCSCETYRRSAIVTKPTGDGCSRIEEVVGYGIASVFTPAFKRGKGYARHMMRLLHWVLAPRTALPRSEFPAAWGTSPEVPGSKQVGNAQFSVLYSDVGSAFYSECGPDIRSGGGWLVRGARQTKWDLHLDTEVKRANTVSDRWVFLSEEQAIRLWKNDAEVLRREVKVAAPEQTVAFAFLPIEGVAAFLVRRIMDFRPDLTPIWPTSKWGVQLLRNEEEEPGQNADGTFATWTLQLRRSPRTLEVTRLRASTENLPSLLAKLLQAAKKEDVDVIEVWNLPEHLEAVAAEYGGVTDTRDDHLPSFKWYGPERPDEVEWLFNERYAWC